MIRFITYWHMNLDFSKNMVEFNETQGMRQIIPTSVKHTRTHKFSSKLETCIVIDYKLSISSFNCY